MATVIHPVRVNHLNMVLEDYDASVGHFEAMYGSLFLNDLPQDKWHACLIDIGRVIFEVFAPHDFFLHTRYGPHYLGIEYQANMDEVREVIAAKGIRVARELGVACHVDPRDCHGIAFEFYDGFFHDNDALTGGHMKPSEFWRDEHPLGLTGLVGYSVASPVEADAVAFFTSIFHCDVVHDEARPAAGARAVGLKVADAVLEVLVPTGAGPVDDHLRRHGEGIRSTLFSVRDIHQARSYFRERGVELVPGLTPGAFTLPAEQNRGVVFEFVERTP
jgi:hypothetical protein